MPKPINVKILKKLGACSEQVELFQKIFGDQDAPLSVEIAVKYAPDFTWNWAVEHFLSKENVKIYGEVVFPHWKIYDKALKSHWKAYNKAVLDHQKAYHESTALLLKTYMDAIAPHVKAYNDTKARIFAELYLTQ